MTPHQNVPPVPAGRFDNDQSRQQDGDNHSQQQDLPEVPPSPTLTNPDMILPEEGERESSTPSPPFRLPSLSDMQFGQPHASGFRSALNYGGATPSTQIGVAVSTPSRPPRSAWTYEGHAPSRPLSDIGEEDIQSSPPRSRGSDWNSGAENGQGRNAEESETGSTRSSSTISARSGQGRWDGYESRSTESNRDEQSGSNEDPAIQDSVEAARAKAGAALVYGASNDDDSSSAILSSEAERILENAKKRLTLMEGNLTRARSSIRLTPSPSPSGLLPLRTGELYKSISQTDRRSSILRPRQVYNSTQDAGSNYHSRVYSETHLPSTVNNQGPPIQQSRSLSALGSTSASSYEADDGSFHYNTSRRSPLTIRPSSGFYHPKLDSLREDRRKSNSKDSSLRTSSRQGMSASNHAPKITTMEEFNSVYPSEGPPSRAQSQLQVRDLRDQAEGLKTKISMLKIKTQEDNLRRRSLQSLRTPSPFTAAEQWMTTDLEFRDSSSSNSNSNSGQGWSPKQAEEEEKEKEESSQTREDEHSTDPAPSPEKDVARETTRESGDDNDDFNSVVDSHYEDAEEGEYGNNEMDGSSGSEIDREALNEILNEPLDDEDDENETYEDLPLKATPHEEREDAFDYENFYLHSALGSFSQDKMRRRSSFSSNDSVETTRPFPSSTDNSRPGIHSRTNSTDSISTAATFATATEGDYSDDEQNAEDEIDLALNWPQVPRNGVYTQQQKRRSRNLTVSPMKASGILTPPGSGIRETSGSVTPVSAFLSANPGSGTSSGLNNDDTQLLEQVFKSLGKVCSELQDLTAPGVDADPKTIRTLRRRLDAARRVLDGQLDA
ncbi:hypothetical protein VTN96DRAFT_7376 [Rasamsonia emersonii]